MYPFSSYLREYFSDLIEFKDTPINKPEPDDSIKYKYIVFSQQRLNYHSQDEVLFKVFEDLTVAKEYALEEAMDKLRYTYRVYRLVPEHAYWMESVHYGEPRDK